MTPPPTDRNQALRDAAEVARHRYKTWDNGSGVEDDQTACAEIADAILAMQEPASEPAEPDAVWIWFGVLDGQSVVTFGRWPKHGIQKRYKLADIQPTEHDHPPASEPAPASAPPTAWICHGQDGNASLWWRQSQALDMNAGHKFTPLYAHPAPASAPSCCGALDELEKLIAACDQGRPHERGVGGMTIDAQMRRTVLNGVPQWPVEQAREAFHELRAQPCRCGELRDALDYLFDTGNGCNGRARIVDLCFTAFMSAKRPNNEDGGPSDWFTDTKPGIDKLIVRMKERIALAMQEPASEPAKGACPVCGCEEVDHRDLWTCRCPASEPAPASAPRRFCRGCEMFPENCICEPAPASAPSCCGWDALQSIVENEDQFSMAWAAETARKALRARAQPCQCGELQQAASHAVDLLDQYANFIRSVAANDLEQHPYLPEVEQVAATLRAATAPRSGESK